jgi:hypothetical protein
MPPRKKPGSTTPEQTDRTDRTGQQDQVAKHERLQSLLQDRKSSTKGRMSAALPVILEADLAVRLNMARQAVQNAESEIAAFQKDNPGDKRSGGVARADVPADLQKALDDAQAEVDRIEDEAADVTVRLVFVALKYDDFDKLEKAHPPRDGDDRDAEYGANVDTFPEVLMRASAVKVTDYDDNIVDLDIDELIEGMSNAERNMACQVARGVNVNPASVPFYDANSRSRRRSGGK